VQIAGLAAVSPGMALAGNNHACAVGHPCRHVHQDRLGMHGALLSAARRARRLRLTSGPAARFARPGEHHMAANGADQPGALTRPTQTSRGSDDTRTATGAAPLEPGDGDLPASAPDRQLERHADDVVQIGAALRRRAISPIGTLAEHFGKEVAEGRRRRSCHRD
jgi:hypothetical protein